MPTRRIIASLTALLFVPAVALAQSAKDEKSKKAGMKTMTSAQKIQNAMGAAPAEIARNATIMDWPDKEGGKPTQLRAGNNGWVCFPNMPAHMGMGGTPGSDPMCLDKQWQAWGEAWMSKKQPNITGTGIAYMLRGDRGASNTDPYASGPTADNQWVVAPAHIMVLYADPKMLDAFPTDPKTGGPWVMWKGTPYAHLMVPVAPKQSARMGAGK